MVSGSEKKAATFEPGITFDASAAERAAVAERAQMRQALKAEWLKKSTNPNRGVGGFIFDPAVQRFLSMRANHYDQFKATPKSGAVFIGLVVAPILLLWWKIQKDRTIFDNKCRQGEIAYADRQWKFI